jgi:hypothetical protein
MFKLYFFFIYLDINIVLHHIASKDNFFSRSESWHSKVRTCCTSERISKIALDLKRRHISNLIHIKFKIKEKIHTLPQDEGAGLGAILLSLSNSSAKPHEQFLQAFRFPLVSQSGPTITNIVYKYIMQ